MKTPSAMAATIAGAVSAASPASAHEQMCQWPGPETQAPVARQKIGESLYNSPKVAVITLMDMLQALGVTEAEVNRRLKKAFDQEETHSNKPGVH